MDAQTQKVLADITRRLPKHLSDALMKQEVDDSANEATRELIRSRHIGDKQRRMLTHLLNKGAFVGPDNKEVDEEIAKQIDAYYEREINRAIALGILKPPSVSNDPFMKKMADKMQAKR